MWGDGQIIINDDGEEVDLDYEKYYDELVSIEERSYLLDLWLKYYQLVIHFRHERSFYGQKFSYEISPKILFWLNKRLISYFYLVDPFKEKDMIFVKNFHDFSLMQAKMNYKATEYYDYFHTKCDWIEYPCSPKQIEWVHKNANGLYIIYNDTVLFEEESDIVAMKLTEE